MCASYSGLTTEIRGIPMPNEKPMKDSAAGLLREALEICDWYAWRTNDGEALNSTARLSDRITAFLSQSGEGDAKDGYVLVSIARLRWALVGCEMARNGLVADGKIESDDPAVCDVNVFNINSAANGIRAMIPPLPEK